MIKVHKLKQPNKHSGAALEPGMTIEIRGLSVTNKNNFIVYVDKFARKPYKPTKAKAPEKKAVVDRKKIKSLILPPNDSGL